MARARLGGGIGVPVTAKGGQLDPGGSIQDRIARAIVGDAERRGVLLPGATLIEATAGNTGVGLALVAASRGYALVCVMPAKMSVDKRVALTARGPPVNGHTTRPPSAPGHLPNLSPHRWAL